MAVLLLHFQIKNAIQKMSILMQNQARNNDRINMVLIIQTTEEIRDDATEQKEQQKKEIDRKDKI